MRDLCIDLDLPIQPLRDSVSIDDIPAKGIWNFIDIKTYINPELVEFFDVNGLALNIAALHVRSPTNLGSIHVDGKVANCDKTKINWSFNDQHLMNWYSVKEHALGKSPELRTQKDRAYLYYNPSEVELIHSQKVGFPSLIQVGIPHSISNLIATRKCISILLYDKQTQKTVPMAKAKDIFKDVLVSA